MYSLHCRKFRQFVLHERIPQFLTFTRVEIGPERQAVLEFFFVHGGANFSES
jgi:hypothetical protein